MSVPNIEHTKSVFQALMGNASRKPKSVIDSEQQRAREAFYKAISACDKAMESVVDKHLESVRESAVRLAEYRKIKAIEDRARQRAEEIRTINENILIERINHRNMLEEIRIREFNKKEMFEEARNK
jgi:hypothetical protein